MLQDIVDVYPVTLSVEEGDSGRILIKGPFGHCEQATSNGRLYKRSIMESNFKKLTESMGKRRLFGELDHPQDGRTSLKRVSHIVTELSISEDGEVVGVIEPLPTPMGNILKALAKAGCELGVSSRGRGSVVNRNGVDEVQDDFVLKTYDVVDNPASKNAFPSISESVQVEAFLESVDEGHRDDVRAAFTEAASKIDTFTLEDIKDEALRAQVAEALGLNESEELDEAEMTPARKAEQLKMAMSFFPHFTKSQQKKMYASIKAMDVADNAAKLDLLRQMKELMGNEEEESSDEDAELAALRECKCEILKLLSLPDDATPAKVLESVSGVHAERNRLQESLTTKLVEIRTELREDVKNSVRAEVMADPQVVGAKLVLENIVSLISPFAVIGSDNDADRLRRENTALADALKSKDFDLATVKLEAANVTKAAAAKLMEARMSELLAGHPKADSIRKIIGPVSRLESAAELESRVESAFEAMGRTPEPIDPAKVADAEALSARVTALESELADKRQKLAEAVELGEEMNSEVEAANQAIRDANKRAELAEVAVYATKKVRGRADAEQVLALCEDAVDKAQVDAILARVKPRRATEDEDDVPVARIQRRAAESRLEENEKPAGRALGGRGMQLGKNFELNLDEVVALAGTNRQ